MGNFQACRFPNDEGQHDPKRASQAAPPYPPFDAMRPSDDTRGSSVGRAVIEPAIARLSGPCGPLIRLVHRTGASCEVFLLGATVASYRLPSGLELLYGARPLSGNSTKVLDGGIPVIFPQYGRGGPAGLGDGAGASASAAMAAGEAKAGPSMPEHGFARLLPWEVRGARPTKEVCAGVFCTSFCKLGRTLPLTLASCTLSRGVPPSPLSLLGRWTSGSRRCSPMGPYTSCSRCTTAPAPAPLAGRTSSSSSASSPPHFSRTLASHHPRASVRAPCTAPRA